MAPLCRSEPSTPSVTLEDLVGQVRGMETAQSDQAARIAGILAEFQKIEEQLQEIRGNQETLQIQLKQIQQESARQGKDVAQQLAPLQEAMKLYETQIMKALEKIAPATAEESKGFQRGLDEYKNGGYLVSITTFQQLLKKYPKGGLVPDAHFWIGECQLGLKKYEEAIKKYQEVITKFPKSKKVPAALLKQGIAFAELKMLEEAKVFWQKLIKEYPTAPESATAKGYLDPPPPPTATAPEAPPPPQKDTEY